MVFNKSRMHSKKPWFMAALCLGLSLIMMMPLNALAADDLLDPDYDNNLPEIVPGQGGSSGGSSSGGGSTSSGGGGNTSSGGGSSNGGSGSASSGSSSSHTGGGATSGGNTSRPPAPSRSAVGAPDAAAEPESSDTQAPAAPIVAAYEPAGFVMRGTAEPRSRVVARTLDESGALIEIASADVNDEGAWELSIPLEFDAEISDVEVVCIDEAGNESELADTHDILVSLMAEKDGVVLSASPIAFKDTDTHESYNDATMIAIGIVVGGVAVSMIFVISNAYAKRRGKKLEQQACDAALQAVAEDLEARNAPAHFSAESLDDIDDFE